MIARATRLDGGSHGNRQFSSDQLVRTCIVILGAVSQILLLLKHKLWEGEIFGDLNGVLGQPLEDQVVHGVTDWNKGREKLFKRVRAAAAIHTWRCLVSVLVEEEYHIPLCCSHLA